MVLEKDPAEDITQLEEMTYKEFFSDINTPGIWKAETEEDLKTAKIIVLDGHSTILVYNQSDEDLPWTAYNELGQYKYTPDNIGDGVVIFSHTFYFEFNLLIGNQMVKVVSTFDGNSIEAIALPMKDVSIDDLFNVMTQRIEDAVNSEVQSFDDTIDVSVGKKIQIPESISMKIGMKLSLMGITLTGMKSKEVIEGDGLKTDMLLKSEIRNEHIVDHVFDEQSSKMKDMLEEEEKELKKRKKAKSKKKVAPKTAEISAPEAAMRSGAGPVADASPPPSPPPAAGPPPVTSPGGSPPPVVAPPSVGAPGAAPPPPPATGGGLSAAKAPPPAAKPKPAKSEILAKEAVPAMADIADMEEEAEFDDDMGFEDSDEIEDDLIAKGMEVSEKPMTLRFTHTSYFSRMLLNRAYPLVVKISMDQVGVKKTITSIASGEKISEKEESIILEEEKSVTIRPEFPGCFVVPAEQVVELTDETIEVKFHVTPLALGMLDGSVRFLQSGKTVHSMHLETKVITHRLSRWLATVGASASVVPTMVAFMLNETPAQFMEKRMDNLAPSIGVNGLAILGVFTAFFLFLSGFVYRMQKPQKSNSSMAFPR
ncbi:MAG: hypothetical protein GPJ54_09950 [Candidatus Heimdallarchaeota archaeon]|nr:hypothetical protein [Candidatus Heimdallarchaeota archaeon]